MATLLLAAVAIALFAITRGESDPGASSTRSSTSTDGLTPEEQALRRAVPEQRCEIGKLRRDADAALSCFPGGDPGLKVEYEHFSAVPAMYQLYYDINDVRGRNEPPTARRCPQTEGASPNGSMICYLTDDGTKGHLVFTDEKRMILAIVSYAHGANADVNPLLDYWAHHSYRK